MDKYDIPFLIKNINDKMPIHTNDTFKIPLKFGGFPKNIMDESHKKDNRFLNSFLSEIEDAIHFKLLGRQFKENFLYQQGKYHLKSGILNHDNFFKKLGSIIPPHHVLCCGLMLGNMNTGTYRVTGVFGADLTNGTATTTKSTFGADFVKGAKLTDLGTVGELYNQVALNVDTAVGNIRLAAYDDSSNPTNLYAETGSSAATADYNFRSVTEFDLDTAQNWAAWQQDDGDIVVNSLVVTGGREFVAHTYGVFPDPFGSPTGDDNAENMKIGHS